MFDDMLQDVRYALRALRSSPGFAAIAILSLALGIGANTAIFSLINAVMLKTLPVSHPEQLVQLAMKRVEYSNFFTNPIWEQVRDRQDVFSGAFAYSPNRLNLAAGGEVRNASTSWVSGDFFRTLGVNSVLGRTITAADDKRGCPAIAVLSYGFWQREYGAFRRTVRFTSKLDRIMVHETQRSAFVDMTYLIVATDEEVHAAVVEKRAAESLRWACGS